MNAPVNIHAIDAFMPWEPEDKRGMRRRLHLCRDFAAKRATYCASDRARALFWDANAVASQHIYASVPLEHLKDVRDTLLRLVMVANAIERWEAGQ